MKLHVIGSSSAGNCYILESSGKKLLLECGVNISEIKKALDFDFKDVIGCLVTHEHGDHSSSMKEILGAGINVYTSKGTVDMLKLKHHRLNIVAAKSPLKLGQFTVMPFDTQHDAAEPFGFLILDNETGERLLFATDTFYLKYQFPGLNYILIECNYNLDILEQNIEKRFIPKSMYRRLRKSHFSLDNVKEFLKANDLSKTRKIVLLHLSDGNSNARKMVSEIEKLTGIDTLTADPGLKVDLELYPF